MAIFFTTAAAGAPAVRRVVGELRMAALPQKKRSTPECTPERPLAR